MADTKVSALTAATLPLDGTELIPIVQGGTSKKVTRTDLTGADIQRVLTATQANSTTTAAASTGLAATFGVGTYLLKYWICYRSSATGTGIQMYLTHTGTTTRLVSTWYTLTTGTTATSGVADQATTATAQMMEGKSQRASAAASGATQGVDTAASDQFAVMEGIMIVTATGTLNFMFNASTTGTVTLMEGTSLTAQKVA